MSCSALTERYISEFRDDVTALRCLPPNAEPRATEHVDDIVALIERIISRGHAYALPGGDVYFETASLPGYGRLSRRVEADNRAGERVAVDARKRGPSDFALWKARTLSRTTLLLTLCPLHARRAERTAGRALLAVALGRGAARLAHRVQRHDRGAPRSRD